MLDAKDVEEIEGTRKEAVNFAATHLVSGTKRQDIELAISLALLTGRPLSVCAQAISEAEEFVRQGFQLLRS